jgi:hypothetical protein
MLLISSATAMFLAWRCNIAALDKKQLLLADQ